MTDCEDMRSRFDDVSFASCCADCHGAPLEGIRGLSFRAGLRDIRVGHRRVAVCCVVADALRDQEHAVDAVAVERFRAR